MHSRLISNFTMVSTRFVTYKLGHCLWPTDFTGNASFWRLFLACHDFILCKFTHIALTTESSLPPVRWWKLYDWRYSTLIWCMENMRRILVYWYFRPVFLTNEILDPFFWRLRIYSSFLSIFMAHFPSLLFLLLVSWINSWKMLLHSST